MSEYTLHLGDCLEYMRTLSDGVFDVVVTDPPYGIGSNNIIPGGPSRKHIASLTNYRAADWDAKNEPAVTECLRVARVVALFGGNYYADILPVSRMWIAWDKYATGNFSECELIYTNIDGATKMIRYLWNGAMKARPEKRYHPTQKPLEVMRQLLEYTTNPGDTIFDPFMGSGTTGVACMQLGRNFVGCEIDPEYYAIAEKRISEAAKQPPLFVADAPKETPVQKGLLDA